MTELSRSGATRSRTLDAAYDLAGEAPADRGLVSVLDSGETTDFAVQAVVGHGTWAVTYLATLRSSAKDAWSAVHAEAAHETAPRPPPRPWRRRRPAPAWLARRPRAGLPGLRWHHPRSCHCDSGTSPAPPASLMTASDGSARLPDVQPQKAPGAVRFTGTSRTPMCTAARSPASPPQRHQPAGRGLSRCLSRRRCWPRARNLSPGRCGGYSGRSTGPGARAPCHGQPTTNPYEALSPARVRARDIRRSTRLLAH